MREERLAHRGAPDHVPRSSGSTEAVVTEGRPQNRSLFVQATFGADTGGKRPTLATLNAITVYGRISTRFFAQQRAAFGVS